MWENLFSTGNSKKKIWLGWEILKKTFPSTRSEINFYSFTFATFHWQLTNKHEGVDGRSD